MTFKWKWETETPPPAQTNTELVAKLEKIKQQIEELQRLIIKGENK